MAGHKDNERLEDLRNRLYSRGKPMRQREKFSLRDAEEKRNPPRIDEPPLSAPTQHKQQEVRSIDARRQSQASVDNTPSPVGGTKKGNLDSTRQSSTPVAQGTADESDMAPRRKKKKYRLKIVLVCLGLFLVSVILSTLVISFGSNTISGENIDLSVTGPVAVGGGEMVTLQVGITNNNAVDIQTATLIVDYPSGTQSATEEGREIFNERLPIELIRSNETINVPIRALIFGEENEEKEIRVSMEYRVANSNATFYKEAEPMTFKISSSPVVLSIDAIKRVASGQEFEMVLEIASNAPNTINDVLVTAEYPLSFDYTTSSPPPIAGQNTWLVSSLESGETETITIRGVVVGKESDTFTTHFSVGVPNERDQYTLASIFSSATSEFIVEQPFLGVGLSVGNSTGGNVVISPGQETSVTVEVNNSLESTIYDTVVKVLLSGNALDDEEVHVTDGFYDSQTHTITWDRSELQKLESIPPGVKENLIFSIIPKSDVVSTPEIVIDVDARARRVRESDVSEELIGTARGEIKVETQVTLLSDATYGTGAFSDTGPIPPVAEEATTYTLSFLIQNTTNEITETSVTATLPPYVRWLDITEGDGSMNFNQTSRELTWNVGSVGVGASAQISLQVEFVPSRSQIGTSPTLVGSQHLRATDRFTGTIVRRQAEAIDIKLSEEAGFSDGDGTVVADN